MGRKGGIGTLLLDNTTYLLKALLDYIIQLFGFPYKVLKKMGDLAHIRES